MGRKPKLLCLEPIQNRKTRRITYEKRRACLEKKAHELSILCDVKICMIIYGPNNGNDSSTEPTTWPKNADEVRSLIISYKNSPKDRCKTVNVDISEIYEDRTRRVQEELKKLCKVADNQAKYPTWHQVYDNLSCPKLMEFSTQLRSLVQEVKTKIELLQTTQTFTDFVGPSTLRFVEEQPIKKQEWSYDDYKVHPQTRYVTIQKNPYTENDLYSRNNMEMQLYQPQPQLQLEPQHVSSYNHFDANECFGNYWMNMLMNNDDEAFNNDYFATTLEENADVTNAEPLFSYSGIASYLHCTPNTMPYPLLFEPASLGHAGQRNNSDEVGGFY